MGDGREQSVKTLERGEETNDTSDAHEAQQFGVGQLASWCRDNDIHHRYGDYGQIKPVCGPRIEGMKALVAVPKEVEEKLQGKEARDDGIYHEEGVRRWRALLW